MQHRLFWTVLRAVGGALLSAAAVASAYFSHKNTAAKRKF